MNKRGFTLLEILIAMSLLAFMTLTLTNITESILITRERVDYKLEQRHIISLTLTRMGDDLSMAFTAENKFQGAEKEYKTGFMAKDDRMIFSTTGQIHVIKNHRDTDSALVGYRFLKGENGTYDLIRYQSDYLKNKMDEWGPAFVLLKHIQEYKLEFYDSNKRQWVSEWDSTSLTTAGRLPQVVKIKLVLSPDKKSDDDDLSSDDNRTVEWIAEFPVTLYDKKIGF